VIMEKKKKIQLIIKVLEKKYPDVRCALNYTKPHELLIATRLSAQCTDKRVNIVTPLLFSTYKSLEEFAGAALSDVEELVKTCGLYKTKAKDIIEMSKILVEKYNGVIPDTVEELIQLPGVGRKTANLIVGELYHKPAVVTDTHVIRLTNLIGLVKTKDPLQVEKQLWKLVPKTQALGFCHRLVYLGRETCIARRPKCDVCEIREYCDYNRFFREENKKTKNK
jgi:endonuclease-3